MEMKNISIGIDLIEVGRFKNIKQKKQFLENTFTQRELKDCEKKNNPEQSLAARFAAKEAVRKTIKESLNFNEIEIINTMHGSPKVIFLNEKIEQKYVSLISISHTSKYAQAVCLTHTINQ